MIATAVVEKHPNNPERRLYHVRQQLTEKIMDTSDNSDPGSVVRILAELAGVESVVVSRYQVLVNKGRAFTWDEVEASVMGVLQFFGEPA